MSQALLEIMEPLIKPRVLLAEAEAEKAGLKKGIQGTVDVLRDLEHDDTEIRTIIKKTYNLSDEEAEEYL